MSKNILTRDFNTKTIKSLVKKGIVIANITSIKVVFENGSWDYVRHYVINDNGTSKTKSFAEMIALAA